MKGERLGEFEEMVLLSLSWDDESSNAVGIWEVLQREGERSVSLGAVYAALDRLERKKFVTSWLGEPTSVQGGRRKRFYELTEEGGSALAELRRVREHLWRGRESLHSDKAG
jgi:DNA-binding PadR family transcriptional regulator